MACGGGLDWIDPIQQSSGRSELLCTMTVLLRFRGLKIRILHSTDYESSIKMVDEVRTWTSSQWLKCNNRDIWECIAFLLDEYDADGVPFTIFHNKAHPEKWKDNIDDYSALEMTAHHTDAMVAIVKDSAPRPSTPVLPGRHRFRLHYGGSEIIGPVRKQMKMITKQRYIAQHLKVSREGSIEMIDSTTFWPAIEANLKTKKSISSRAAVAKFLYNWWATNYKLDQRKQLDPDDEQGANCECGAVETAVHILYECKCKRYVDVRNSFSRMRSELIHGSQYSDAVKTRFSELHEIRADGTYPNLSSESVLWADSQSELDQDYKTGNRPLCWFQKGPLPKSLVSSAADALEIDYDDAAKFCKKWFEISLDESILIWRARNFHKHGKHNADELIPWHELRTEYFSALKILKSSNVVIENPRMADRHQMVRTIKKASDMRLDNSILAHVTANGNAIPRDQQRNLLGRLCFRESRGNVDRAARAHLRDTSTQRRMNDFFTRSPDPLL